MWRVILVGRSKYDGMGTATRRESEGAPTEVTQYRRNAVIGGITIRYLPCGPSLHHCHRVYILLGVRALQSGGILNLRSDRSLKQKARRLLE